MDNTIAIIEDLINAAEILPTDKCYVEALKDAKQRLEATNDSTARDILEKLYQKWEYHDNIKMVRLCDIDEIFADMDIGRVEL